MAQSLADISRDLRLKVLEAVHCSGKGHLGGALSVLDCLVALCYGRFIDLARSGDKYSNQLILSKGHAAVSLYAILVDQGLVAEDELFRMNRGGALGEHPDFHIPGVPFNTGSLGHGLGIGVGLALGMKKELGINTQAGRGNVFVVMGDGECYVGSVWESAVCASALELTNLVAVVDRNRLITHGDTEAFIPLEPFSDKWLACGWDVLTVAEGNDPDALSAALNSELTRDVRKKPLVIVAETVKGKGVSFMEGKHEWHHGGLDDEQFEAAKQSLLRGAV